jgi:hypothetical protein
MNPAFSPASVQQLTLPTFFDDCKSLITNQAGNHIRRAAEPLSA